MGLLKVSLPRLMTVSAVLPRDHPLKTLANFYDFWPLPPSRRQFFTTIRRQICPSFQISSIILKYLISHNRFYYFILGSLWAHRNWAEVREGPSIPLGSLLGAFEERAFLELRRSWAALQECQRNLYIPNQVPPHSRRISWKRSRLLFTYFSGPIQSKYMGSLPYATFGTWKNSHKPKIALGKYLANAILANLFHYCDLAYAFLGYFISLVSVIFGPKIAQKSQ